jgi:hypothetical protein
MGRVYEEMAHVGHRSRPFVARALLHRGEPERAREMLDLDVGFTRGQHLEALCEIAGDSDDLSEAQTALGSARVESGKGLQALPRFADRVEGRINARRGDLGAAEKWLMRSVEGFSGLEAGWEEAYSRLLLAEVLDEAGHGERARVLADEAGETFRRLRSVMELRRAEEIRSRGA